MSTKLTPKQTRVLDEALNRADQSSDVKTKTDADGKYIRTPWALCEEIVGQIAAVSPLSGKKILVVDTVEFIPVLLAFGAEKRNITYVAPYEYKGMIASVIGVRVVQQNLLEWKPDMKFDVVIGNPPYQDGNKAIWKNVIKNIYNKAAIVALVTPRTVVNGEVRNDGLVTSANLFEKFKSEGYLHYIDYSASSQFNVGKEICAWIYIHNKKGTSLIVSEDEQKVSLNLSTYPYLPYRMNSWDFGIFSKIYQSRKLTVKDDAGDTFIAAPKSKHLSFNQIRVVVGKDNGLTAGQVLKIPIAQNETDGAKSFIASKFFKFCFYLFGGSDGMGGGFFRKFPRPDLARTWTDAELYAHFGLTQEEIDYIEATIK